MGPNVAIEVGPDRTIELSVRYNRRHYFNMADEEPPNQEPRADTEQVADRPHRLTVAMSTAATFVSLCAAAISMYSAHFAALQYENARGVREDARQAAAKQRKALEDAAEAAKENLRAVQRSADAAAASAKAGEESLLISKRSLELNERPVLRAFAPRLLRPLTPEASATISIDIVNEGRGMATKVTLEQYVRIAKELHFEFTGEATHSSDVLGPTGATMQPAFAASTVTDPISITEFRDIQDGRRQFYVYGLIRYDEQSFHDQKRLGVTFCYYYVPSLQATASVNSPPFARCTQQPKIAK